METHAEPRYRLTLAHLVLWLSVSGVLFGIHRMDVLKHRSVFEASSAALPPDEVVAVQRSIERWILLRYGVIPFYALALTGTALLAWRRWRLGRALRMQPGYWLLLNCAACISSKELIERLYVLLLPLIHQAVSSSQFNAFQWTLAALPQAVIVVVMLLALQRGVGQRWWQLCFVAALMAAAIHCTGALARALGGPTALPIWIAFSAIRAANLVLGVHLATIWVCAGVDWSRSVPRDMLHFAGLAAATMTGIFFIIDLFDG